MWPFWILYGPTTLVSAGLDLIRHNNQSSCKLPFFLQHMHNDLVDSNADSNVEKSLWTLVDSSRENPLVCYTLLDTTGLTWTYHVDPETFRVIGRRTPKVDALDKVTGRAQFGADVALPRMLVGKVLAAPMPTRASSVSIRAKPPRSPASMPSSRGTTCPR